MYWHFVLSGQKIDVNMSVFILTRAAQCMQENFTG